MSVTIRHKKVKWRRGKQLYQRQPSPYSYFTIFICSFSFCSPLLLIIYLIVPLSTSRRACEELRLVSVARFDSSVSQFAQNLQPNSSEYLYITKTSPLLPLASAILSSPVATLKTVLPTHLHPVQRLRIGGARTPPLLYALLACTESLNFPLPFPCKLCFFPAFCVTELVKNCPNINPLQPSGHYMHHQFNIQQLYVLPTLYLCVLYLSQNKQRLVPLIA